MIMMMNSERDRDELCKSCEVTRHGLIRLRRAGKVSSLVYTAARCPECKSVVALGMDELGYVNPWLPTGTPFVTK